MKRNNDRKEIVVIGAGFAGLWSIKTLFKKPVNITVIDKNNYHTFLPLLYQVGAAEIEPEQIAYPIRSLIRGHKNVRYMRGTASHINSNEKFVLCNDQKISYDYLVIATGSGNNFFNIPGAETHCFTLKTLDDAMILRNHILSCFERASYCNDAEFKKRLLSFAIIGGGPTGVEYSGALAELINGPLLKDFPRISKEEITVNLVESTNRVLSSFKAESSAYTHKRLNKMGVDLCLQSTVKKIEHDRIIFNNDEFIVCETIIWTAGVKGETVSSDYGLKTIANNRMVVTPTLQLKGSEDIYIAGDLAFYKEDGAPLPMIAPVAAQQGRHAAANIWRKIKGKNEINFKYIDKGAMATIGRNAAITRIGPFELRGFFAWIVWLFIHILYLIGFRNKIIIMIHWFWNYIFFDRAVRLILPGCCDNPDSCQCQNRCADNHT